jgi:hypothetical protein
MGLKPVAMKPGRGGAGGPEPLPRGRSEAAHLSKRKICKAKPDREECRRAGEISRLRWFQAQRCRHRDSQEQKGLAATLAKGWNSLPGLVRDVRSASSIGFVKVALETCRVRWRLRVDDPLQPRSRSVRPLFARISTEGTMLAAAGATSTRTERRGQVSALSSLRFAPGVEQRPC